MPMIIQAAARRLYQPKIWQMIIAQLVVILVYSGVYWWLHTWHNWDADMFTDGGYFDALYFTVVTHFAVGYGDITPRTRLLKVVCMSQIIIAFILFTVI